MSDVIEELSRCADVDSARTVRSPGCEVVIEVVPSPAIRAPGYGLFYFSDQDNAGSNDSYRLCIDGAKKADALGLDAVWTPERHFTGVGAASPSPSVLSAALAMVTRRIAVRAGSVVLPLHHPVQVAEEWAMVDRLSGGRAGVSFASGWVPDDFIFAPNLYSKRTVLNAALLSETWLAGICTETRSRLALSTTLWFLLSRAWVHRRRHQGGWRGGDMSRSNTACSSAM